MGLQINDHSRAGYFEKFEVKTFPFGRELGKSHAQCKPLAACAFFPPGGCLHGLYTYPAASDSHPKARFSS